MSLKIGLTGNIGSGKTTVSRLFALLGVPVYNADVQAKLFLEQADVIRQIVDLFGAGVLDQQQRIDRKKLAKLVFGNDEKLQQLNGIIHPLVRADYESWHAKNASARYTIQESAILFETGYHLHFDRIIVVSAPESLRIERVCKRDNTDEASVRQRMKQQMNQKQLEEMASYVIVNDERQPLIPGVLEVHRLISNA